MKILLVDFSYFMFRAIYAWKNNPNTTPLIICLNCMLSNIKKVGLDKEDLVILATDSEKNWRKDIDKEYKKNRKKLREKQPYEWNKLFADFRELGEKINQSTPFYSILIDYCEADDIIAVACKKFKDNEKIIIGIDSDLEQLVAYQNVKIFSPLRNNYKTIINPYKVILQKIKKERSDNLVGEINTLSDYEKRKKLVNLLDLPKEIEESIDLVLSDLPPKTWNYGSFPIPSIRYKLKNIYSKEKVNSIFSTQRKKRISKKQLTIEGD